MWTSYIIVRNTAITHKNTPVMTTLNVIWKNHGCHVNYVSNCNKNHCNSMY